MNNYRLFLLFFILLMSFRNPLFLELFHPYFELYLLIFFIPIIVFDSKRTLAIITTRSFLNITLVWVFYVVLVTYFRSRFSFAFSSRILIYLFAGTYLFSVYGIKIFEYLSKWIYWLILLGIPLHVISLINYDALFMLMKTIGVYSDDITSVIFFTLDRSLQDGMRYISFAWEPGPTAVAVIFGLIFNFTFHVINSKKYWLLALITVLLTKSVTGFILLLIVVFFTVINQRKVATKLLFLISATVAFVFIASTQEYIEEKINEDINEALNIENVAQNRGRSEVTQGISRTGSLIIHFQDFLKYPVLGYGPNSELSFLNRSNLNIASGGLTNVMARYGSVIFFLFIVLSFKAITSLKKFGLIFNRYVFWLSILVVSISFVSILLSPFYFLFLGSVISGKMKNIKKSTIKIQKSNRSTLHR